MSVYFIRDDRGRVKIGLARDTFARLAQLQTGSSSTLAIIRVLDGGPKTERWLHRHFAARHVRGEWFWFSEEMLTVVPPAEPPAAPSVRRPAEQRQSLAAHLAEAADLGLMPPQMQERWAPMIEAGRRERSS